MASVTGIGGVFFRSADPSATIAWYHEHLGLEPEDGYPCATVRAHGGETTVWAPFPTETTYFGAREQPFMINYRVDDLDGMLEQLRARGVEVSDEVAHLDNGAFGWAVDCDGRRFELWQPAPGH